MGEGGADVIGPRGVIENVAGRILGALARELEFL